MGEITDSRPWVVRHIGAYVSVYIPFSGCTIAAWQTDLDGDGMAHRLCDLLNDLTERVETAEKALTESSQPHQHHGPQPMNDLAKPYRVQAYDTYVSVVDSRGNVKATWSYEEDESPDVQQRYAQSHADILNARTESAPDQDQATCDFATRLRQLAKIDMDAVLETIRRVAHHNPMFTTCWFREIVADRTGVTLVPHEAVVLLGGCSRIVRLSDGLWFILPEKRKRLVGRMEFPTPGEEP